MFCRMYTAIIAKPCRIAEAGISKQDFIKADEPNSLLMSVKNNHSYPFVHFLDKIHKNITLFASQTAISSVCNPQTPLSRGPVGDNKDAGEKKDDESSGVTQLSR